MREGALDHVAALIRDLVERWDFLAGWIGLDDRGAAPCNQEFAKLITVIGCVGQHLGCLRQLLDEAWRWANIAHLPSGDVEGDQTAGRVGDGMDLGRPPAAAATDCLLLRAPFSPGGAAMCLGGGAVDALCST